MSKKWVWASEEVLLHAINQAEKWGDEADQYVAYLHYCLKFVNDLRRDGVDLESLPADKMLLMNDLCEQLERLAEQLGIDPYEEE